MGDPPTSGAAGAEALLRDFSGDLRPASDNLVSISPRQGIVVVTDIGSAD